MKFIARGTPTSARRSGRTALGNLGFIIQSMCLACVAFMCSGCCLWHLLVLLECIGVACCYWLASIQLPAMHPEDIQSLSACSSSIFPCMALAITFWCKSTVQQWALVYKHRGWADFRVPYIYNAWFMSSQCLCGVMLQLAFLSVLTIGGLETAG